MTQPPPAVGVILEIEAGIASFQTGFKLFAAWGVPYEVLLASPFRAPDDLRHWVTSAPSLGIEVIIVIERSPALSGIVASHTLLPVVAFTPEFSDSPEAQPPVLMPPGVPVATVTGSDEFNAAFFALQIMARIEEKWEPLLRSSRSGWIEKLKRENEKLLATDAGGSGNDLPATTLSAESYAVGSPSRPGGNAPEEQAESPAPPHPGSGPSAPHPSPPEKTIPHTTSPGLRREPQHIGRIQVDAEMLAIDVAENATDCLLDGGIVALPTDTVYGLAVDATNPDAVRSLCEIKGRDADKPIAVFIESQRQLAALVRNLTPEVRQMLEAFWPGPLTVVFERRGDDLAYLAQGNTIGVRLPDHSIALALLQELRRPIACSSANPSGAPPARSADEVEQYFGRDVHMILDAGKLPSMQASTVIDVTRQPFRVLREGPISRAQLGAVLGDLLESDETH